MNIIELFYTQVIPLGLWAVMLALGLSLTPADVVRVFTQPKAAIGALTAQMLLLPLIALGITLVLDLQPAIAAGLIILAACPGGASSGAYVFASRGDAALSISVTAVNSMLSVLTMPFITFFAVWLYMDSAMLTRIPVQQMIWELVQLTIIPVALGMLARGYLKDRAKKFIEPLRTITLLFLICLIVAGTIASWDVFIKNFWAAAFAAGALNILAMAGGYGLARLLKLDRAQTITIVFEVGIHNVAMAMLVTMSIYKQPALAITTLVYAVLQKVTALAVVSMVRRWNRKHMQAADDLSATERTDFTAQGTKSLAENEG